MAMTEKELWKLFVLLRKPIPWDPAPEWARLTPEQMQKFNEVQSRFNTKLAQIDAEKIQALNEIMGARRR